MIRTLCLAAVLAGLSACGFRPLYGNQSFGVAGNSTIQVSEIAGRGGYLLRQNLLRELAVGIPGVEDQARLTVKLNENLTRAALFPDGGVARSFLEASASYVLETNDGPVSGNAKVRVPYAATPSPYDDVSAQIGSTERAMDELARGVVEDLRVRVQAGS